MRREVVLPLLIACLLVLAGCSGINPLGNTADETATDSTTPTVTSAQTSAATPTPTPTAVSTPTPTPTATATPTQTQTSAPQTTQTSEVYQVGEAVEVSNGTVAISQPRNLGKWDGYADAGNSVLEFTIAVENTANTPLGSPYASQFVLLLNQSGTVKQYSPDAFSGYEGDTPIQPGATYEETLVYEVPTPEPSTPYAIVWNGRNIVWSGADSPIEDASQQ